MYVDVNLAQDPQIPRLRDPEDFTAFTLTVRGEGGVDALDAALGNLGHVEPTGEHAWLTLRGLRSAAGSLADSPAWSDGFDAMVRYADSKGWLSPQRDALRAHIERQPVMMDGAGSVNLEEQP